jgi:hypothetical protein
MGKLTHYQTAFFLSILSGVMTFVLWAIVFQKNPIKDTSATVFFWGMALVVPFGLWLGSNFARYVGAVFMLLVAASLLWPLASSHPGRLPLAALFVFLAGINLITAAILLLSKQFAAEWTKEREQQSKYKVFFRRSLLYAIIVAMIVATLIDIIHLASN